MTTLLALFGPYAREATGLIFTFLETQLCISLFAHNLEKRRYFFLRILFFELLGLILFYGLAIYNTHAGTLTARILCYLSITGYCLLYTFGIFRGSPENMLIAFCSGEAAHQLVGKLYPLMQNLAGINDKTTISFFHTTGEIHEWEWLVYWGFHIGMYLLVSRLLRPKKQLQKDPETTRGIVVLSVSVVFTINVLTCISRTFEGENLLLSITIKTFVIALCSVILLICAGLLTQNEKTHQLEILQQLWKQDQAQFQSVKAGMDAISMKCHDLKHILNRIEGKLNEEEAKQLRNAISFYDSRIKTGNDVLDVVLSEKNLVCQNQGIQFISMLDGSLLSFLTPVQTYTVFGNIMDNAIEAVMKLPEEMRIISLNCQRTPAGIEIEESNYFDGRLNQSGTDIDTTKADQARHGFGIKSIQYIARQYGGSIETIMQEDMFFLRICFPTKS